VAANEPVREALDRLLDSLGVPAAKSDAPWDEESEPVPSTNGSHGGIAMRVARARLSRRPVYRIPRLLAAWVLLVAAVCAFIWIVFSLAGLK